jgi:hypothetical protein
MADKVKHSDDTVQPYGVTGKIFPAAPDSGLSFLPVQAKIASRNMDEGEQP